MTSEELTVCPACEVPPPRAQHADAFLARERQRMLGFLDGARRHHADRHHLVMRGVGCVAPARERIEHHIAGELRLAAGAQGPGMTVALIGATFTWHAATHDMLCARGLD